MRLRTILPVVGLLALAACNDSSNQTGSTNQTNPPPAATTAPANPTAPAPGTGPAGSTPGGTTPSR